MAKKKKDEKKNEEALVPEVVDNETKLPELSANTLLRTREDIKNQLALVDKTNKDTLQPTNLETLWDELCGFADTNDMIKLNLQQIQVYIQQAWQRYWRYRAEKDAELAELATEDPASWDEQSRMAESYLNNLCKNISNLMRTATSLAREYRSCNMQKKYMIHINKIEVLKMIFTSAIHKHIHDNETLGAISKDVQEGVNNLLPMEDFE